MKAPGLGKPLYISYFDGQANLDKQFLHPGGSWATERLISHLPDLPDGSVVLEIGCGTGGTALRLLERFPMTYLGIDASPEMLTRARKRLARYENQSSLFQVDLTKDPLPFQPGSIDLVISESVLAILDARSVFTQSHSLLKKGGILAINERIWSERATPEDRRRGNRISHELLGFQAAPESLGGSAEWIGMLREIGFELIFSERIDTPEARERKGTRLTSLRVRKLLQLLFRPSLAYVLHKDWKIGQEHQGFWIQMENWIFIARKK